MLWMFLLLPGKPLLVLPMEFLSLSSPLPSFGVVTAPSAALPLQFDVGSWDLAGSTSHTDLLHFLDLLPEKLCLTILKRGVPFPLHFPLQPADPSEVIKLLPSSSPQWPQGRRKSFKERTKMRRIGMCFKACGEGKDKNLFLLLLSQFMQVFLWHVPFPLDMFLLGLSHFCTSKAI